MKSTSFNAASIVLALASLGATVVALPLGTRADAESLIIMALQFALTLEHLENAFYTQGLAQFDEDAFEKAGFPDWVRGRFVQIGEHEANHVSAIESSLGTVTSPCNYSFPYTDPKSFVSLAATLEGIGSSAYFGTAVVDPSVLTITGSILPTEARHNGWITSSVMHAQPWNAPFETPLGPNQAFTLVSSFIKSCPSSNPTLPFNAFPALTFEGTPASGQFATVDFSANATGRLFVAFLSGLRSIFLPLGSDKTVLIPSGLQGTVYAVVTNSSATAPDANTIAGPAILQFPFSSKVSNV